MKITRRQLRQIIKEEVELIKEDEIETAMKYLAKPGRYVAHHFDLSKPFSEIENPSVSTIQAHRYKILGDHESYEPGVKIWIKQALLDAQLEFEKTRPRNDLKYIIYDELDLDFPLSQHEASILLGKLRGDH